MITNGWCYVFILLGSICHARWMLVVGSSYAAFLYFPFTIEKPVTIAISIWLQAKLFPRDKKLHRELILMGNQAREDFNKVFKKLIARHQLRLLNE